MPIGWKILRIAGFLQMLLAFFNASVSFIDLFTFHDFYFLFATAAYALMASLAILALSILKNNYPDIPVADKQKTNFNWLFLLNFFLLTYIFGLVFARYLHVKELVQVFSGSATALPFKLYVPFIGTLLLLIFQLIILYGLYVLRQLLYQNFRRKEFEFERKDG